MYKKVHDNRARWRLSVCVRAVWVIVWKDFIVDQFMGFVIKNFEKFRQMR